MSYSIFEVLSIILNLLLGGGIIALFTMRSQRKKVAAEASREVASADSAELDNVEKAIKIWREMAESLKTELQESREKHNAALAEWQVQAKALKTTVEKLNTTNAAFSTKLQDITRRLGKILKLLEKISPDNIEGPVEQIKNEIHNAHP
jgi:predicted  nucleic acid-binding Zn-ribbon protein